MRHLYVRIYLTLLAVVFVCILLAGFIARRVLDADPAAYASMAPLMQLVADQLPDDADSPSSLSDAVGELAQRLRVELSIWSAEGELLAASGGPMLESGESPTRRRWLWRHRGVGLVSQLDDGRWMGVIVRQPVDAHGRHLALLATIFAVMAVGCYPLARQITRRLESLRDGVENWGAGDLSARVAVSGRDEVATLAESFNDAASRIEALVDRQKRVLVHASHELRSPLARLRMALELLADEGGAPSRGELLAGAVGDTEELDELIGEILLAARLETAEQPIRREAVDLFVILAQEAERVGATVAGGSASIGADPSLVRRMLRNLFENARRYSDEIEASVETRKGGIRIVIADRGPGVPEDERERIFEPFYRPAGHREGAGGGVGLGLALVRWIAERHGGTVRCRGREGGGSEFVVDFEQSAA